MKLNFIKSIALITIVAGSFASCANDDDYAAPDLTCIEPNITANKTVAEINALASNATPVLYTSPTEDAIEAYVTSSDERGNFFKTISLQTLPTDGTAPVGLSVAIDANSLFGKNFYPGRKVYIKLNDLHYAKVDGSLKIGALYEGEIGRISEFEYLNKIVPACTEVSEEDLVRELTIAQTLSNANINTLVELQNVQFKDEFVGGTYYDALDSDNTAGGATNRILIDNAGNEIIFRTSSFANFSGNTITDKSGSVRGVLTKYESYFQFVARNEQDIKLTEVRIGEEPETPGEPGTTPPELPGTLLFAGGNFNNYSAFIASVNSFGLKPYATESPANGLGGTTALRINGTPTANDYVFTVKAPAGLPTGATKITFWIKGTATGKALSFNVSRSTTGYDVFNLASLTSSPVILLKNTEINSSGNGTNQYTGSINTNNQWVKVTLDISDVTYNTTAGNDIFSLKTGNGGVYDLYIDNFIIE